MSSEKEFFSSLSDELTGFFYAHLNNPAQESLLEEEFTGKQMKLYRKWKQVEAGPNLSATVTAREANSSSSRIELLFQNLNSTILEISGRLKQIEKSMENATRSTVKRIDQLEQRIIAVEVCKAGEAYNNNTLQESVRLTALVYLESAFHRLENSRCGNELDINNIKEVFRLLQQFPENKVIIYYCSMIFLSVSESSESVLLVETGCFDFLPQIVDSFWSARESNSKLISIIYQIVGNIIDKNSHLMNTLEKDEIVRMLMLPQHGDPLIGTALNTLVKIYAKASSEFVKQHGSNIDKIIEKVLCNTFRGSFIFGKMDKNDFSWCLTSLGFSSTSVVHFAVWKLANEFVLNPKEAKSIMKELEGHATLQKHLESRVLPSKIGQILRIILGKSNCSLTRFYV